MNAYLGKAFLFAILLAGFVGVYFKTPVGDRSFALGVWLDFSSSQAAGFCFYLYSAVPTADVQQSTSRGKYGASQLQMRLVVAC